MSRWNELSLTELQNWEKKWKKESISKGKSEKNNLKTVPFRDEDIVQFPGMVPRSKNDF